MTDASAEAGDLSLGTRLVEAVEFFGLQATDDEMRWLLPISRNVSSFRGSMLGGCALAAVAAAGEMWSGRPLAAVSAQFLARVPADSNTEITLEVGSSGRHMTQAAALVTDAADGRPLMRALLSLGGRRLGIDTTWAQLSPIPPLEECRRRAMPPDAVPSFSTDADIRYAPYHLGDTRIRAWARIAGTLASTPQGLIALADTLGSGMRVALGLEWRGGSLDNTVRITGETHSEWVILDYEIDGFHNAVGHGVVRIFSPDGDLLATGSQSFAVARVGRSSPQFAV